MRLIPKVNGSFEKQEGYLTISEELSITMLKGVEEATDLFISRIKHRLNIVTTKSADANIKLVEDSSLDENTYKVVVDKRGIEVEYSTLEALGYALTTVYHLVVEAVLSNGGKLTYLKIEDSPKYQHRGISVDTARHFFPIEELKKIVEQLALVKINVFHWHIVDDQGFRMESKVYPELNKLAGNDYYKQEEIIDFVNYAKVRGVEIIPEIDIPGHTSGIIYGYPELSCRGEQPNINKETRVYKDILCGGKDEVYTFLEKLLNEVAVLFQGSRIHLGGDEVPKDRWKECPHCNAKLKELSLESYEDLQGHILNFAKNILEKHNKTVICWNDSLKAGNLDEDINVQYWLDPNPESYSVPKIQKGRKVVFSEMFSVYFDYSHNLLPMKKTYDYTPLIRGISFEGFEGTLGLEACIWSENIYTAEDMHRQVFPRIIALAEAAWSTEKDYNDFIERLGSYYGELDFGGITGKTLIDNAGNFDEGRIQRALQDLGAMFQSSAGDSDQMGVSPEEMQAIMQSFITGFFSSEEAPAVMDLIGQMMQ